MKLKKLILFFGLLISSLHTQAQIENVLVEKYYISDDFDGLDTNGGHLLPGSVTYRIYIDLPKGSKLLRIYGDENHPFMLKSTETIFNHKNDGQSFGKDFKISQFGNNTVALDSWLTIGQISKTNNNQTYYGIPKEQDIDSSFIGGINNDGGSSAIPFGLLNNTDPKAGTPLFKKDGIQLVNNTINNWGDYGIKNFLNSDDSTIFGSIVTGKEFNSSNFYLGNIGTFGADSLKNEVLIAQVTTAGELSFALNIEVLENINGVPTKVQYVSNDSILKQNGGFNEKFSKFLKYPFTCGCIDQNYVEFNPKAVCSDLAACKTKIVLGCMDPKACNYDPTANVMMHNLCCYPGSCNNRDIAEVCPSLLESALTFEIHPNPSHNYIYINAKTGNEELMSYTIYDVFGNNVLSKTIGNKSVLIDEEVNIEKLPNGIYHLRLSVGNALESKTFIKN
jgi:hypothetical protein